MPTIQVTNANLSGTFTGTVTYDDGGSTPPPDGGSGGGFDLSVAPFTADSAWNKPLKSSPRFTTIPWEADTGYNFWCTWDRTGVPVYWASPSDPIVRVTGPSGWGWPDNPQIHLPDFADGCPPAGSGEDNPMVMIETDTGMSWNFWRFRRTGPTSATCGAYGKAHIRNDTGWGKNESGRITGAGTAACGASQYGGLLVQAETDAGEIKHALGLAVRTGLIKPGTVAPAVSNDGKTQSAPLMESQLLAIPPTGITKPSGLSPLGTKVWTCFRTYGAYVTDDGGSDRTTIRAMHNAYDQATMDALRKDTAKLIPLLKLVS